jgi:hypothetical protein
MATILAFKPAMVNQPRSSRESLPCQSTLRPLSAELIFFPGVRYERHEPVEQAPPQRSKRRRAHEVLELPD